MKKMLVITNKIDLMLCDCESIPFGFGEDILTWFSYCRFFKERQRVPCSDARPLTVYLGKWWVVDGG